MVVRFSLAIFYVLMPVVALAVVSYILVGEFDPLLLLPQYLRLRSEVSPGVARAAFGMLPRAYLLPLAVLSLYSFALLAGMYLRWRPVFYLLLGGVAVRFALAVTATVLGHYYGLICGGFGIGITIASFFIVISVQDDFFWDSQRVYLQLDRRSTGGAARMEHARALADKGMWALAVLYLRAAIAKMPGHAAGYVRLAHAYLRLGRSDLAQDALSEAMELDPSDPSAVQFAELLREEQRTRVLAGQAGRGSPTVRSKVH
jgi:tetratricopeptide (TPR) repeat protein